MAAVTTSRYAPAAAGGGINVQGAGNTSSGSSSGNTNGTQSSATSGSQSGSSSGSSSSSTSGTKNGTSSTTGTQTTSTQNMSPQALATLEALIAQLMNGGSQEDQVARAQRQQEVEFNQASRQGYSKDAAFNDAQGLMAQTMRTTLEKLLPSINRAAEGAGASQGSMRALLTQQAQQQAAEAASAQGLQAAISYGNINTGFSSILERLTQPDNSNNQNLLNALGIAKGAVVTSTTNSSQNTKSNETSKSITDTIQQQSTQQSSQQNTDTKTNQNTTQNENKTVAPISVPQGQAIVGSSSNMFSNSDTGGYAGGYAGTTVDLLRELNRDSGGGWSSGFTF